MDVRGMHICCRILHRLVPCYTGSTSLEAGHSISDAVLFLVMMVPFKLSSQCRLNGLCGRFCQYGSALKDAEEAVAKCRETEQQIAVLWPEPFPGSQFEADVGVEKLRQLHQGKLLSCGLQGTCACMFPTLLAGWWGFEKHEHEKTVRSRRSRRPHEIHGSHQTHRVSKSSHCERPAPLQRPLPLSHACAWGRKSGTRHFESRRMQRRIYGPGLQGSCSKEMRPLLECWEKARR